MTDSVMGGVLSDLRTMHMFEQIPCMSFVLSDRRTESRSWMSPSPKDGRKRSKEINTASSCLDMRRLRPEDVWYRVGEAVERGGRRCQLWHVVAKERLLRRFLRPPFLGSTNTSASTVNAGVRLMTGVLHLLIFQCAS